MSCASLKPSMEHDKVQKWTEQLGHVDYDNGDISNELGKDDNTGITSSLFVRKFWIPDSHLTPKWIYDGTRIENM